MALWEDFEEYLFDQGATDTEFNSVAVAEDLGISRAKASQMIQSYLDAQVAKEPRTLFVLTRKGRTSKAVWHVGVRAADARHLSRQTVDDYQRRLDRFVGPTLQRIAERNPRALPAAKAVMKSIEAQVEFMEAMLIEDVA